MRVKGGVLQVLMIVLIGLLLIRSGTFMVRIAHEWNQLPAKWQPANENERLIWQRYQEVK